MRSFCGAVCHQFKFAPSCAQIHSRADQKACLLGYEHMILIVHNRMGERGALTKQPVTLDDDAIFAWLHFDPLVGSDGAAHELRVDIPRCVREGRQVAVLPGAQGAGVTARVFLGLLFLTFRQ